MVEELAICKGLSFFKVVLSCRPDTSAEEEDIPGNTSAADLPEFDEPVRRTSFLDMLQQTAPHENEVHIS